MGKESLIGRAEQYLVKTADVLRAEARHQEGAKRMLTIATVSGTRAVASEILKPLRQVEEKLRGIN